MENDVDLSEGRAYRWALGATGVAMTVIAVAGVVVGAAVRGVEGVWAALAGVAVAAISGMVTQAAMMIAHRREPALFASIVVGAWLGKMLIIVLGVLLLSSIEDVDRGTFGVVVLIGVGTTLAIDLFAVKRARISYTGSSSDGDRS